MKSFFNLVQSVQKQGRCSSCLGCAVFCRMAGFNALELNAEGKPEYGTMENCIECGLCHSICPATGELDREIKALAAWKASGGRVVSSAVVRAGYAVIRTGVPMGGALAAVLAHLFDRGQIDGVVLTLPGGYLFLGASQDTLADIARSIPDDASDPEKLHRSQGLEVLDPFIKGELGRIALVGAPCQIRSFRKMQVLNLIPAHAVAVCFGLFCTGDAQLGGCRYCADFSSEFADISWGATGVESGWGTLITRTDLGQSILSDSLSTEVIEPFNTGAPGREAVVHAMADVDKQTKAKAAKAERNRRSLRNKQVQVNI